MQTITEPKELEENNHYQEQRKKVLSRIVDSMIDLPIIKLINDFNELPCCFTLQSCYGHFLYEGQCDPNSINLLPHMKTIERVEYRIAYIAFCIENSESGKKFLEALKEIPVIDPENIQFCCADWFWKRQVNSYALQVEPDRFKHKDTAILDYSEALHIEKIRNEFYVRLQELIQKQHDR